MLERLYIADMRFRFSQSRGHFPNVFLVEARQDTERPILHPHTYWLKYLILMLVRHRVNDGVKVRDVVSKCVDEFGYQMDLVLLALGSLYMISESRCIEFSGSTFSTVLNNRIRLTSRGRVLVGVGAESSQGQDAAAGTTGSYFPYCFELSYLQMVVDDYQLTVPTHLADLLKIDTDLRYALQDNGYRESMTKDLERRLRTVAIFTGVLEASFIAESFLRPAINSLRPDFYAIKERLKETIDAVCRNAGISESWKFKNLIDNQQIEKSTQYFLNYYREYTGFAV